jgi:signal transduction histidine kinase
MLRNATLELLKFSSFPELGAAVKTCTSAIMKRWQAVVVGKLPTADKLTLEQLRDEMPIMLVALARTLESANGSSLDDVVEASEGHGKVRFHQSYNINELLVEYGLLRPILLDEVITELERELTTEESASLNMGIDIAVRKAVNQFVSYQQAQLTAVAQAQSKYLSFLSHDLRGGLNGVLLMVEVLKRELAGEAKFSESIHDLDSMRRSILDTVGTMDRFLHAEQFRQGKVQPRNSTVDLHRLAADLQLQFTYQAKAKSLELQSSAAPGMSIHTDRDLVMLILQNLLSNAIKYTATGTITLAIDQHQAGITQITVTDHGPGIAADRIATLFDPFTRGETHGQTGVGLGLSIAKQAADLIGAKLSVRSKVGDGAVFMLELKAAQ